MINTGIILKKLRTENNLTLEELANNLNSKYGCKLNKGMLSKWESGKSEPRFDYAKLLARYFKVSIDYLLGMSELHDVGHIIRQEREEQRITEKELADAVGVSVQTIIGYELDEDSISFDTFEKIANYFDLSSAAFLSKYGLYDEYIPAQFNGDVDRYEAFKKAVYKDISNEYGEKSPQSKNSDEIDTVAAHLEGKNITPQKMKLLEKYIDALFEDED